VYSKEESKKLKQAFWTAFGVVMKPHHSAEGLKINWVNYKTEVKNIVFSLEADNKSVTISIDILHNDAGLREIYFEQFEEFKMLFHTILEENWYWNKEMYNQRGMSYSSIYMSQSGNIFDQNQWQEMFAFLKHRLLKLDEFWSDAKEIFKSL